LRARVRAAFFAEAERDRALRFRAAFRACWDRAFFDAAARPDFFAGARRFVDALFFAGSFTPDRRAFESPMAMACSGDRAPCFPSRT
jgi:hypothetical protein